MFNQSSHALYFPSLLLMSVVTPHVITDFNRESLSPCFLLYLFFLVSSTSLVCFVLRMPNTPSGAFCPACTNLWLCSSIYMHVCACVSVLGDKSPMSMTDSPLLSATSGSRPPPRRSARKVGPALTRQASAVQCFFLRSPASQPFHCRLRKKKKNHKTAVVAFLSPFALSIVCCHLLVALVSNARRLIYLPFQRKNWLPTHMSRRQFMKIRPR